MAGSNWQSCRERGPLPRHVAQSGRWLCSLYPSPQQTPNAFVESLDHQKNMSPVNYRNSSFSMALQDLIGIDSANSGQAMVDDSGTLCSLSSPNSQETLLNIMQSPGERASCVNHVCSVK
ncbi:hypothetical protein CJ030_MR3G005581 [Morella rubra]|uniref:Uncharacterized protein n=1 Tax=Morella rubra TaxID=262757 RepID=A0A6A1W4D2_9ROSI|nr:hypothetical protein CJ030_MR3G005581 [Morella rubra]